MGGSIEARGIDMQFEVGGKVTPVLSDINLDIRAGEFFSIVGPSGCGKSTFLSLIAGLARHNSGSLTLDGAPLESARQRLGMVFQGYALYPWRTVIDNVATGLEIRGVGKRERRRVAAEFLEMVGLEGFAEHYPHELSGGMKQRVSIARALAYQPDVLLMDEPFAALDAQTREILQEELLDLWSRQRKTIVFITHSLDEAIYLSDRVAVMTARPGRIKSVIDIPLPRPRGGEIRNSGAFVHLRQRAWEILRDEVQMLSARRKPRRRTAAEASE